MYQGTTPVIPVRIKGVDLTEAKIYLTFRNKNESGDFTFVSGEDFAVEFDGEDTVGEIALTQERTLSMAYGPHEVQARFVFEDGTSGATKRATTFVNNVILKDVIRYGR